MARKGRARKILFRIFYSTSFTIVFLVLLCFIVIAPADAVYQSYRRNRITDIFLLAGAYVLTAIVAIFLYASRLYTNRSVLKDIPKTFMPVEKEDLPGSRVKRLIDECLSRSAVVAYHAKPRSKRIEVEVPHAAPRILQLTKSREGRRLDPGWGSVAHPGWSSPASLTLPNLEYVKVIDELVDLIEAKAVSLAPLDPETTPAQGTPPLPDREIVEELTRPDAAGMRQYLAYLVEIGLIIDTGLSAAFLNAYERARFGAEPLTDTDFQALMRLFAEVLRDMDRGAIDLFGAAKDAIIHDITQQSLTSSSSRTTLSDKSSGDGSIRHHHSGLHHNSSHLLPPSRVSEDSAPSLSEDELDHQEQRNSLSHVHFGSQPPQHLQPTARPDHTFSSSTSLPRPTIPQSHTTPTIISTSPGLAAPSTRPSIPSRPSLTLQRPSLKRSLTSLRSNLSFTSVKSQRSQRSRTGSVVSHRSNKGSVIRLAVPEDGHRLPYTIEVPKGD